MQKLSVGHELLKDAEATMESLGIAQGTSVSLTLSNYYAGKQFAWVRTHQFWESECAAFLTLGEDGYAEHIYECMRQWGGGHDAGPNISCETSIHTGTWSNDNGNSIVLEASRFRRVTPQGVETAPMDVDDTLTFECEGDELHGLLHGVRYGANSKHDGTILKYSLASFQQARAAADNVYNGPRRVHFECKPDQIVCACTPVRQPSN